MAALLALLVRVVLAPGAFARPSLAAVVALAAFAGFAAWTLASSIWSDAPARALLEYDRTLLYGALLAIFVSLGRTEGRARALVAATALGCAVVGIAALGPWLLPETFPIARRVRARAAELADELLERDRAHRGARRRAVRPSGELGARPPGVARARRGGGAAARRGASCSASRAVRAAAGLIAAVVYLVARAGRGGCSPACRSSSCSAGSRRRVRSGSRGSTRPVPSADALDTGRETAVLLAVAGAAAAAAARGLLLLVDARLARWRAPRMAPWPARALGGGRRRRARRRRVSRRAGSTASATGGTTSPRVGRRAGHRAAGAAAHRARQQRADRDLGRRAAGRLRAAAVARAPARARTRCCGSATVPRTATCSTGTRVYLETLGEMGIVGMALLGIALVADARRAVVAGAAGPGPGVGRARRRRDRMGGPCGRRLGLGDAGRHRVGVLRGRPRAGAARVEMARRASPRSARTAAGHPRRESGASSSRSFRCSILRSQGPLIEAQRVLPRGRLRADDRPLGGVELGVERTAGAAASSSRGATCASGATRWPSTRPRAAVRRDPRSWEPRYTQALVLAAAGQDPRPRGAGGAACATRCIRTRRTLVKRFTHQEPSPVAAARPRGEAAARRRTVSS